MPKICSEFTGIGVGDFCRRIVLVLALLLWAGGCTTMIPTADVASFSGGVTAAKTQTDLALAAVAAMTRQDSITYASRQKNLRASNLVSSPDPDTIASWDALFSALEKYAQDLNSLAAGGDTTATQASLMSLAGTFNQTAELVNRNAQTSNEPQVTAGVATAFAEAAKVFESAYGQKKALELAAAADPHIAQILNGLADAIGATQSDGLRATIAAHWRDREAALQVQFLQTLDPNARLAIVQAFAGLLDQASAQDLALASVRRSLLALAVVHHALAAGHPATMAGALGTISDELQNAQAFYRQVSANLAVPVAAALPVAPAGPVAP